MKLKLFALGKRYDVQGRFEGSSLTVLKGSRISDVTKYGSQRDSLVKKLCINVEENLILTKDLVFQTPTAAANFCTGGSVNGWNFWKDSSKRPLKDLVGHKAIKRPRKKKDLSNDIQSSDE